MDTAPFALVRHGSLFASMDPGLRRDDGVAENTAASTQNQINSTFDTT